MELSLKGLKFAGAALIALVLSGAYAFLSNFSVYIKQEVLLAFSFSVERIHNIFSYLLVHTGFSHLAVNIVSGAAFAIVVESVLGFADTIAIFVVSGVLTAVAFTVINPNTALIGASAGVSGLLGASFFLDPKKAIWGIVLSLAAASLVIAPVSFQGVETAGASIDSSMSVALQEQSAALAEGNLNNAKLAEEKIHKIQKQEQEFAVSRNFEIETKTDFWIHGYGAVFGCLYVLIFRREKMHKAIAEVKLFERFLSGFLKKKNGHGRI